MPQQWFPKQGGSQIVEEEEQLGSCTDVVSRGSVERYNRFNSYLPGDRYVGKTWVHGGNRLCSPRTVKRELDKRHKLVERLFLWRAAGESTGQIERAEFDRKTPMQDVDVTRHYRDQLATDGINARICRDAAGRMLKDNGAGNAKRPQPRQIVRQIAEAFAEKEARLDCIGRVGVNTLCTGVSDTPNETRRKQCLVEIVSIDFPFDPKIGDVETWLTGTDESTRSNGPYRSGAPFRFSARFVVRPWCWPICQSFPADRPRLNGDEPTRPSRIGTGDRYRQSGPHPPG